MKNKNNKVDGLPSMTVMICNEHNKDLLSEEWVMIGKPLSDLTADELVCYNNVKLEEQTDDSTSK